MNWANLVTYFRLLLIPLVVVSYHSELVHSSAIAAFLFTLASLSDWLDGYLARKLNLSSEFGAFLDPVADKLLVVTVLIFAGREHGRSVAGYHRHYRSRDTDFGPQGVDGQPGTPGCGGRGILRQAEDHLSNDCHRDSAAGV